MAIYYPAEVTAASGPVPDPVDALLSAWRSELPDALRPTTELSKRIVQLAGALDAATREVLPGLGLTVAEFDILVALRRSGEPYCMKPNELVRALLLSSGGISNVVNHLAGRGLVLREPSPDDGRSTMIRLTPDGVRTAERAVCANADAHEAVFAEASPVAVHAAARALREVGVHRRPVPRPLRTGRNRSRS
ncbi:MarR family winged helix-turn-helix transcriptional regulator [Streptomyces sp. NPDC048516]|uniref:MarR family winged helix-turn-helix transcriptional regulator n=1 Tax=Streptomyces sp. NPDC048516 TaxID=3365565 RepID=UPI003712052C